MQKNSKLVMTGNHLSSLNKNIIAGNGCYISNDNIYASLTGYL